MMTDAHLSVDELIEQLPQLSDQPELAEPLKNIFQFTQFLLDDDDNLTRTGNLNAEAKRQLQARIADVFDMASEQLDSDAESPADTAAAPEADPE